MKYKLLLLVAVTLLTSQKVFTQNLIIKGRVIDFEKETPLIATIIAGNKGTIANQDGAFETDLSLEYHWFLISYVGCYTVNFTNVPTDKERIDFGEIKMVHNHRNDHIVVGGPPSDKYDPVKQKEQDEKVQKEVLKKYRIKVNGKKLKPYIAGNTIIFDFGANEKIDTNTTPISALDGNPTDGTSALKKGTEQLGISVNLPTFLEASKNSNLIYPAEITEKNPLPTIAQQFGGEPASGNTYFNVLFGKVNSILTYKEKDCEVIVYMPPGRGGNSYGKIIQDSTKLHTLNNISFGRIKSNFKYGINRIDASELEADELYSMLTHYPYDRAKKMFNANAMLSFPLNLRGNIYDGKYTRGRAVVVGKDRHEIYLYFMMTDKSSLDFENFLNDFDKVFWFNE